MTESILSPFKTVRTTVTLPNDLAQRTQRLIEQGKAPNRNALVVAALEHFIAELEREEIDRQFAALADDAAYRALNEEIAESFADSDWEALTTAEQEGP